MKIKTLSLLLTYRVQLIKVMKRLILNTFLFAVLSTLMVACSKEEVKPFSNGPAGSSVTPYSYQMRDGGDDPDVTTQTTDPNATSGTTTTEGTIDIGGNAITDGGNSPEYDSKSSKRRKN
jgi:hypothetical protein